MPNARILQDALPHHVLCFFDIPPKVIEGEFILFHPSSPKSDPPQQKSTLEALPKGKRGLFSPKIPCYQSTWFPRTFRLVLDLVTASIVLLHPPWSSLNFLLIFVEAKN